MFDGVNEAHYTRGMMIIPVRRKAYWEIGLDSLTFGDDVLEFENIGAALDIGTSFIVLSTDLAGMLNSEIGVSRGWDGQYAIDCGKKAGLPNLSFNLDGNGFVIGPDDYTLDVSGFCVSLLIGMGMFIHVVTQDMILSADLSDQTLPFQMVI